MTCTVYVALVWISYTEYVFECHCLLYNYGQIPPYFVILDNNNDDDDNDNNYNNDNNDNDNNDDDYDNKNNNNDNDYSHHNDANNSHCIRIGVSKTKLSGIIDIIGTMS